MTLYAACSEQSPHIVAAFINNDVPGDAFAPPVPLPQGFLCIKVSEQDVASGKIALGMEYADGKFVVAAPPVEKKKPVTLTDAQYNALLALVDPPGRANRP